MGLVRERVPHPPYTFRDLSRTNELNVIMAYEAGHVFIRPGSGELVDQSASETLPRVTREGYHPWGGSSPQLSRSGLQLSRERRGGPKSPTLLQYNG